MSVSRLLNKQTVVYLHNGTLFSKKTGINCY